MSIFSCAICDLYIFFGNMFKSFAHLKTVVVFLLLSFESFLYIEALSPVSDIWFANIIFQSMFFFSFA